MLNPAILQHRAAILDAWNAAGMVRLARAVLADQAMALHDRVVGARFEARMTPMGLVWYAPDPAIGPQIERLWSDLLGRPASGQAEVLRYRKGSWAEAERLEEVRWSLDLTPLGWDEADGGFSVVDGVTLPIAFGALDIFAPGRVIEVPLLTVHRDRLLVTGVLR